MADDADVIVVGAGVAGSAAAAQLAAAGRSVLMLEREHEFSDRVRGEGMVPWGFEAARQMGLDDAIRGAPGSSFMTTLVAYDEMFTIDQARKRATSLVDMIPGVPGLASVGHPELRQALLDVAVGRGASLVRGVEDVSVAAGHRPAVSYTVAGEACVETARLVIGADGKESTIRRGLGVELASTIPTMMLTGLLVDDGGVWNREEVTIGVHGENQLYVFPRKGALRLYIGRLVGAERFGGADRAREALAAFRVPTLPYGDTLAEAEPIGPCASFPMSDTWTREPYADGVVLVGDAAGWSNPVTGQGLAVALRDAKVLTDLLSSDRWDADLLDRYAAERFERMARLRFASALTDLMMGQGVADRNGRRRRIEARVRDHPEMLAALGAVHLGPWRIPDEAFEPSILAALAVA